MIRFKSLGVIFITHIIAFATAIPYRSSSYDFTCNLTPTTTGRLPPPRPGDNGFSVKLEGKPEYYNPEKTYTVTLRSTHPVTFRGFALTAVSVDDAARPAGSFKILNPWSTKSMLSCSTVVTHATAGKKGSAQFVWTSPSSGFGCVRVTASVIQKGTIWFKGDEDLSTEICEATESSEVDAVPECCSCGVASYRMTFYGMWSPQSHPKYYPEHSTHWSNVIGASHDENYVIWDYGTYASDGVKKVAEWGWPNALEDEIRGQGKSVRSVIKTRAQWPAYQPRNIREPPSSLLEVDKDRHLVSLVTMLGPSPDWNVGITKESMCTAECGWEAEKIYDLTPWDAGTDSGISYISANSPTNPPEKIRALTSSDDEQSPFYNASGGPIPPLARLVLTRLAISGEQCGPSPTMRPSTSTINTNVRSDIGIDTAVQTSCMYAGWSKWSSCAVTCGWGIKTRTKMLKRQLLPSASCESSIMEKEICKGSTTCDNEDLNTICLYSEWSEWSACTCENEALRFRTRALKWPSEESSCHEPLKEMKFDCPATPCGATASAGCTYSKWTDWMPCTSQCGIGQTLRKRFVTKGERCSLPIMETTKCMTSSDCSEPVGFDVSSGCNYSPWTGWMPCPVSCGPGQTFKKRVLISSVPSVHCKEVQIDITECLTSATCPQTLDVAVEQKCIYSDWSDWMACSASCDVGNTQRKRSLKNTSTGSPCKEIDVITEKCYMPPCHVMSPDFEGQSEVRKKNCIYGPWTAWMSCSVTCGKGETLRKRFLVKSLDTSRTCEGFVMESNACTVPCGDLPIVVGEHVEAPFVPDDTSSQLVDPEIDCSDITWGDWSSCSATCGTSTQSRYRNVPEQCRRFITVRYQQQTCAVPKKCPIDCLSGEWSEWSICQSCGASKASRHLSKSKRDSTSAVRGWQVRTRKRLRKAKFGGASCPPRKEKRKCRCE